MASKQACKLCRRRKVKCDGSKSCNNCHVANTPCQYSPPKKRGPKPVQGLGNRRPRQRLDSRSARDDSPVGAGSSAPPSTREPDACATFDSLLPSSLAAVSLLGPPEGQTQTAITVHLGLLDGLLVACPSQTAASIAHHCILLYTQHVFGALPMCHEASLRATVERFFITYSGGGDTPENRAQLSRCFVAEDDPEGIVALRRLTLLTALCAAVTCVVPESVLPDKHLMAPLFLRASRETLRIYEDYDLEYPDSSSLGIRLFFSSALQSATGRHGASFHILGEAGLISMRMRLYDESSLEGRDPIEETLLRNAFWQLYICDKTALVMKIHPVVVHETLFESHFTLKTHSRTSVSLFDHGPDSHGAAIETRLVEGFHIIRRLWAMAARVVRAMESRANRLANGQVDPEISRDSITQLSAEYFEMITATNDLPELFRPPEELSTDTSQDRHMFDILHRQRTSYLITLYSIKIFLLNAAIQCDMLEIVGQSAEPLTLAMRQIELAQGFLYVLKSVPFLHLQVEGEHCAEKIRRVGSLLLELAHRSENEGVKSRANECAMFLIDLLVRLDSKASDVLGQ